MAPSLPASARLYVRPSGFIDAPFGFDGQCARLAGGLLWFSAYEVIAREAGRRVGHWLVPVCDIDAAVRGNAGAQAQLHAIAAARPPLQLGARTIRMDQPQVMGILNLTPDSFSDGGRFIDDPASAAAAGIDMAAAGAAIIDVGGESTRPGAKAVWVQDEIARIVPVIERLAAAGTAVSIDTRQAETMEAALAAGATLINDVSALCHDPRALDVVVQSGMPVVLMHSPDAAKSLHGDGEMRGDPLLDVYDWLEERVKMVVAAGVDRAKILVDPGIGFGKGLAANLAIINGLALFHGLGCPLVVGASRKRLIGALSHEAPVGERLGGSLALALTAAQAGVQMVRVHDVAETVQALKIWRGLRDAALTPMGG